MKKGFLAVFLIATLMMALSFSACSNGASGSSAASAESASSEAAVNAQTYGYAGDDPAEAAVYKYMAEEVGKQFEKADASIPVVSIVHVDSTKPDEVLVFGDFWIYNYNIEGNTLECVSGGDFPGVMHLSKDGDGFTVSSFDMVADGADFASSAKELFDEYYDDFMNVYGDDDVRNELRKQIVSDYVSQNGLAVTQYQDYGWEPVELNK